ncbi:MAG: hypothetical protein JSV61_07475 [Anaerolineales bacterium]|nr:MAG: hypothetical protein JSV61_07475 [Anaerolineales bacterium]
MICPNCQTADLLEAAKFCHKCGYPLEITRRFTTIVKQDVEVNRGRVIGIETDHLTGDVYASGDFFQVQVYALSQSGRDKDPHQFFKQRPSPYMALKPYTANEALLFKGREEEKWSVISRIGDQPVVTLYGTRGVGKTSLLAAAVIPELARKGALVLHLHEYHQPLARIIVAAIRGSAEISYEITETDSLNILLSQLYAQAQGTFVFVLDHLESVFQPDFPQLQRNNLFNELAQAIQTIGPEYLRIICAVEQGFEGYLGGQDFVLPDVLRNAIFLQPLDVKGAIQAIEEPPGREGQDYFYNYQYAPGLVESRIVGDLDRLSGKTPGYIHPPHLQIVCDTLYSAAKARSLLTVDERLYLQELRGASRIVDSYLYNKLSRSPENQQLSMHHVLKTLTSPVKVWYSGSSFPTNGVSQTEINTALETLNKLGLLVQRRINSHVEYALTNQDLKNQLNSLVNSREGRTAGIVGEDLLSFLWSRWESERDLPSTADLISLRGKSTQITIDAAQATLFMRSAFRHRLDPSIWYTHLKQASRADLLVSALEKPDQATQAELVQAGCEGLLADMRDVLVMDQASQADESSPDSKPYGKLAEQAINHQDWAVRRTAASSITLLGGHESASRLQSALEQNKRGLGRNWRKAELFGSILEIIPDFTKGIPSQPPLDRFFIRVWQVWSRILLDRHRVFAHLVGSSLGAGLGLGILRFISGILRVKGSIYGPQYFFIYSIYGAMLGFAVALGHVLGQHLPQIAQIGEAPGQGAPRGRNPTIIGSLAATLLFGLAVLIQMGFAGFYRTGFNLAAPFGFLAGAGISTALANQPRAVQSKARRGWWWRLGLGAITMLGIQGIFLLFPRTGGVLTFTLGNSLTREMVLDWTRQLPFLASILYQNTFWGDVLVLLDMLLVGIILVAGMTLGMALAEKFMNAWLEMIGLSDTKGE